MNRPGHLLRTLWFSALVVLSWLSLQAMALAQAGGAGAQKAEDEAPPYVLPATIVILCIAGGLAILLSPSRRRERAKPEVYGEPT